MEMYELDYIIDLLDAEVEGLKEEIETQKILGNTESIEELQGMLKGVKLSIEILENQ